MRWPVFIGGSRRSEATRGALRNNAVTISGRWKRRHRYGLIALALLTYGLLPRAQAGDRFNEQGGEAIFQGICQGCHMAGAIGAAGAGSYPALAGDSKLSARAYPLFVVINGQKAMPAFGAFLDDRQIADIVNYIRSHFGNRYTDEVTPDEVRALRPQVARPFVN